MDIHDFPPYYIIIILPFMTMMSSSYYYIMKSGNLFSLLKRIGNPLSESEEKRLDELLTSIRNYHSLAIIISGILLALSTLEDFGEFLAPFGNIRFPSTQTALSLYILVIILLLITDYMLLMAYPWLGLDQRRPPFAWFGLGLDFQKSYPFSVWFTIPLLISSLGMVGILSNAQENVISISTVIVAGFGLVYFPRTIYYTWYFIQKREDHRGGSATFSIQLLQVYRYIRQVIYTIYIASPIVNLIPSWKEGYNYILLISAGVYLILFLARWIFSLKRIYRKIDLLGKKFGFPIVSNHYK